MKKIINNRMYNTDTANQLGYTGYGSPRDFGHYVTTLYQKKNGEFFLHGIGGPASQYRKAVGMNEWSGDEVIKPLSRDEAREWAEKHLSIEEYISIFGEPEE